MSSVWVQLYIGDDESGGAFKIKHIPDDISDLKEKVYERNKAILGHCVDAQLVVYSHGTKPPFSNDNAVDPGDDVLVPKLDSVPVDEISIYHTGTTSSSQGKAIDPGDPVPTGTKSNNPLIVVAPAPKQTDAPGVSAEQISSLVAFAQEELDNRTKHKAMSEASVQFATSILAGNGIQTAVEDPIREAGSLVDPPKFSWEVVDSGGHVWNNSEHAGTPGVVKWANEHLLAGEKEYGLKVVTGAVLPKVKGNRKSAAGKGDIAIGKLENMEYGDTFTFVNGLVELKTDRSSCKKGQNLLELFALSMTSKFGRGVALLATDCDETWETFHFSKVGVITHRFYDHGGKAWEDFMKLIKSAEVRQLQNSPPASLATIKEDHKGEEDEQNLDGFAIPAHEKKRQRALDDQAMLERIADHLGELYGERPVVPSWAHAEARIPDYYV
ncbi:expressed unknown protein [Seminavis robusta]|uniref:Uncharacterized protein n=1 Tax=Seminavis robusta TaxID=568900 RepID=A0A9N8HEI4_9STRA|nr:expressed unknown protein [Seminavis robusta]|eukprot:Sro305_g112900.1 n/a (440) ;mRNA; f:74740-76159